MFKFATVGCSGCRKKLREEARIGNYLNYIDKEFGALKVIGFAGFKPVSNRRVPFMRCECQKCGNFTEIPLYRLKAGQAKQCSKCAHKNLSAGNDIVKMAAKSGSSVLAIKSRKANKNNRSGHAGVSWVPGLQKWRAYITFRRRQYYLGLYDDYDKAVIARETAEKEIYEKFLEWYEKEYPEEWEKINRVKHT